MLLEMRGNNKDTLPETIANAIEEHWNDDLESISIAAHDRIESLFSMTRREKRYNECCNKI